MLKKTNKLQIDNLTLIEIIDTKYCNEILFV